MIERENEIITSSLNKGEEEAEKSLRPDSLNQYIGQEKIKEKLNIFIEAAKLRDEPLDHVLLYGPPGLGKTTLSTIISHEMNVNIRITSGPAIERPGDLAAILTNLNENDVLFIDEIHRLNRSVEEVLYPAMEDYALDIIIGKGPSARSIRLDLPKFTLIGATTRAGSLTSPLRDRFGVVCKLDYYSEEELVDIVKRSAEILSIEIREEGAFEICILPAFEKNARGKSNIPERISKIPCSARPWHQVFSRKSFFERGILCYEKLRKKNVYSNTVPCSTLLELASSSTLLCRGNSSGF